MSCEIKTLMIIKTTQFGEDLGVKFQERSWEIKEIVPDQSTREAKHASGEKLTGRSVRRRACLTTTSAVVMVLGQLTVSRVSEELSVEWKRADTNQNLLASLHVLHHI